MSASPQPESGQPTPPQLQRVTDSFSAGLFHFSYTNNMLMGNTSTSRDKISVLLIQIESIPNQSSWYFLHYSPPAILDLSFFACLYVNVSFAVIEETTPLHSSLFSPPAPVCVHGGK